jgi:dephospho-CoA kinase
VLIDAPQLFEAGVDKDCDLTLGVIAPDALCVTRIMERDGISRENAEKRLAAQHKNEYFQENCTAVIENADTQEALEAGICQFLKDFGV